MPAWCAPSKGTLRGQFRAARAPRALSGLGRGCCGRLGLGEARRRARRRRRPRRPKRAPTNWRRSSGSWSAAAARAGFIGARGVGSRRDRRGVVSSVPGSSSSCVSAPAIVPLSVSCSVSCSCASVGQPPWSRRIWPNAVRAGRARCDLGIVLSRPGAAGERVDHLVGRGDPRRGRGDALAAPGDVDAAEQVALGVLEDLVRAGRVFQRRDLARSAASPAGAAGCARGPRRHQRVRRSAAPKAHLQAVKAAEARVGGAARQAAGKAVDRLVERSRTGRRPRRGAGRRSTRRAKPSCASAVTGDERRPQAARVARRDAVQRAA